MVEFGIEMVQLTTTYWLNNLGIFDLNNFHGFLIIIENVVLRQFLFTFGYIVFILIQIKYF